LAEGYFVNHETDGSPSELSGMKFWKDDVQDL